MDVGSTSSSAAPTLRELLEQQRMSLDPIHVVPSKNYLTRLEPINTKTQQRLGRPTSPSTDGNSPGLRVSPTLRPAVVANTFGTTRLHEALSHSTDMMRERARRGAARLTADERDMAVQLLEVLRNADSTLFAHATPRARFVTAATSDDGLGDSPSKIRSGSASGRTPKRSSSVEPVLSKADRRSTLPDEGAMSPPLSSSPTTTARVDGGDPQQQQQQSDDLSVVIEDDAPAQQKESGGQDPLEMSGSVKPGGTGSSFRFLKQFKKLKAVSATPEIYKNMVQSKDAMEALFRFSTHCSRASLGGDEVLRVIEQNFVETTRARSCAVYSRDTHGGSWQRGLPTDFLTETLASTTVFSVPEDLKLLDPDSSRIRRGSLIRPATAEGEESGSTHRLLVPISADGHLLGAAELCGVSSEYDASLLENMASIAGMFLRNNNSFLESQWQRRKVEAMLSMARTLAEESLEEERLVRRIMLFTFDLLEADRCTLFVMGQDEKAIMSVFCEIPNDSVDLPGQGSRTAAEIVATTRQPLLVVNPGADPRLADDWVDRATGLRTGAVLAIPVFFESRLVAVLQLTRMFSELLSTEFTPRDVEVLETFATFVGVCLRNCRVSAAMVAEKRKTEAILSVVRDMNRCDIRDVQAVVSHILTGARKLLSADRATLFLVDKERHELYSEIADATDGQVIRFPIGRGIAGVVAKSGKAENICDAYADPRFNKAVDLSLGYTTRSMLTEAVFFQDDVIAVAQLVNKKLADGSVGVFTAEDESTFRAFSLFAGISLRNSHLLNFAVDAGREAMELQQLREGRRGAAKSGTYNPSGSTTTNGAVIVKTEVCQTAVSLVMALQLEEDMMDRFGRRNFNLFQVREELDNCADVAVSLIVSLFRRGGYVDEFRCDITVLTRFVIACREKYRNVPYHNFYHAVDVCQTVYTFIHEGRVNTSISRLDEFVLLVTALCHDLDHMGLNNSFHLKTDSPLGMLSSASGNNSVLEVHHCNVAIEILSHAATDVFAGLTSDQKTHAYRLLIDCVLATDMQRHNDIVTEFSSIDTFNVGNENHVGLACKMVLKAADISNVTKPFPVSRKWGMSVTEEFYQQGDQEKAQGRNVLPMFDRSLNNELAKGQIGFIDFIALPFFRKFADRFLSLRWCCENIESNKAKWQELLEFERNEASLRQGGGGGGGSPISSRSVASA